MGPSQDGKGWGAGAHAHKAFSGPIRLLPEGEHVWNWFPALAMISKALVHREQEEAENILVRMASTDLGVKPESAAFLSKHSLGLSLVSGESFTLANTAPRS